MIIFVVDLPSVVLKSLISAIEPNPKEQQSKSEVDWILEKFPKHKRYIAEIFDEITEKKHKTKHAIVGIFSISDNYYRLIL